MLTNLQIEQFIESIFPTKKPGGEKKAVKPAEKNLSPEEAAKLAKRKEEEKWDMIYMFVAVGITLLLITLLMVSPFAVLLSMLTSPQVFVAWMAGARFDLAFKHLTSLGKSPGPEAEKVLRQNSEHSEL